MVWLKRLYFILALLPVGVALFYAAKFSFGLMQISTVPVGNEHWGALLADVGFHKSLGFSLLISMGSLVLAISGSFVFASVEVLQLRPTHWRGVYELGLSFPPIVAAFLASQWMGQSGWLSRIMFQLGWVSKPSDFPAITHSSSPWGLIIVHGLLVMPFFTLYIMDRMQAHQMRKLFIMSKNFGVSWTYFCRKVLIPVLLKSLVPISLLYLILLMGSYEIPLLIGGQSPKMFTLYILENIQQYDLQTMPKGYAAVCFFFLLASIAIVLLSRFLNLKISARL